MRPCLDRHVDAKTRGEQIGEPAVARLLVFQGLFVNTAIIMMAQGLGFAIPSNTAQWVVGEILAHGRVRRRLLGIAAGAAPLSRSLVRELDLLTDHAVEVVEVQPRSPAAAAGVRVGDLIIAFHGRVVTSVDDIHRLLTQFPPEQPLALSIIRNGARVDLEIHASE